MLIRYNDSIEPNKINSFIHKGICTGEIISSEVINVGSSIFWFELYLPASNLSKFTLFAPEFETSSRPKKNPICVKGVFWLTDSKSVALHKCKCNALSACSKIMRYSSATSIGWT